MSAFLFEIVFIVFKNVTGGSFLIINYFVVSSMHVALHSRWYTKTSPLRINLRENYLRQMHNTTGCHLRTIWFKFIVSLNKMYKESISNQSNQNISINISSNMYIVRFSFHYTKPSKDFMWTLSYSSNYVYQLTM